MAPPCRASRSIMVHEMRQAGHSSPQLVLRAAATFLVDSPAIRHGLPEELVVSQTIQPSPHACIRGVQRRAQQGVACHDAPVCSDRVTELQCVQVREAGWLAGWASGRLQSGVR
jgi:hypothetical protein